MGSLHSHPRCFYGIEACVGAVARAVNEFLSLHTTHVPTVRMSFSHLSLLAFIIGSFPRNFAGAHAGSVSQEAVKGSKSFFWGGRAVAALVRLSREM